jgi:N-acetylglucosaminyldiphosphoundecaprenol N-acetyl-beta-D-mannosaminyltransferase
MVNILGINITSLNKKRIWVKIKSFLTGKGQHYIVTPNPEIILAAQRDEELFYILNHADLSLPDGIGLVMAGFFLGCKLRRITGADLTSELLFYAEKHNLRVVIFVWRGGLSREEEVKRALGGRWPNLEFLVQAIDRRGRKVNYKKINTWAPKIMLVGLGAPWQEKFIYHNLPRFTSVKLAVGVGGAIDFLTGRARRAPRIWRQLGMEWLWRLIRQPNRLKRIWRAVVIFPLVFFRWRFINSLFYRPNVVGLVYKRIGDKYYILLVERADEPGHWQLPQGGTDGQAVDTAGLRELREELNCDKFRKVAVFKNLYKYKFVQNLSKFGNSARRCWGYRGQKQSLLISEFLGDDKEIKLNFWDHSSWRWVQADKILNAVHPVRRQGTKIFLRKFWEIIRK